MATPSSNTPLGIITDAMQDAGLLQEGDSPNSEQFQNNLRRLNDLINLWQTQGLKLWLNQETVLTPVAGQALYTLGAAGNVVMVKPMRLISASYYDTATYPSGRPLSILSWEDYTRLGQRTQTGTITSIFEDRQATTLNLTLWQVPTAREAEGTIKLLLQHQVTNPISLTETMNFPAEWRIALRWGLADELATGQPQAIMDRCTARAATYRKMLEDWDVESAPTRFLASGEGQAPSRFR